MLLAYAAEHIFRIPPRQTIRISLWLDAHLLKSVMILFEIELKAYRPAKVEVSAAHLHCEKSGIHPQ